jgi:glycosyltransferase 2 family protein
MSESRIPPESLPSSRSSRWLVLGGFVGFAAVALVLIASDGRTLLDLAGSIDLRSLALPLACTAGSYAAMARSYQRIAAAAGLRLGFGEITRLTLVSTSANYVLSTGGLSGVAVRSYYFSQQHRLRWGSAVSISLAQTFITNLVLFAFLFWGVLNVIFYRDVGGRSLIAVFCLFFLALAVCLAAVAVVAYRGARLKLFGALIRLADLVSRLFVGHRSTLRSRLALFEEELHEGVDFLIERRSKMVAPLLYVCVDWFLMLATLYVSFRCIRLNVPMHIVIIGFSTGVFLSTVNLVPGGLGIMEGTMAAVFAGLGVPLEAAVIATLIFRLSYYVVPLLVSLVLFRDMMRSLTPTRYREPSAKRSLA